MKPITLFEKASLVSIGAAAAFKSLLWSLNATIDSTDPKIGVLRVIFAALSFVAFDLVIAAVVLRGWSASGAVTILVAALVSAALALDVAGVWVEPALHAAPAVTLAAFSLHLMLATRATTAALAPSSAAPAADPSPPPQASAQATAAVQVNVAQAAPLPRTVAEFIAARAAMLPGVSQAKLAAELETSADTVRRALTIAAPAVIEQEVIEG
jgi:hypothetical protein